MKKLFMNLLLTVALVSCSSYKTLYTMEDIGQPSWATEAKTFEDDGDHAYFIGVYQTDYKENTNINLVKSASENLAWSEVTKKIMNDIENEQNLNLESQSKDKINLLVKQISKSIISKAHVSDRWYKVIEREVDGKKLKNIIYYTRVKVSKNSYLKTLENTNN
ncbi:hypothetical protein [Halobacteriovorax sp.]|uniref:hypothetical protein n=1 Tax=Halobacteriovorax sp. TaxID=2020862 RepID=UPI003AF2182E